MFGGNTQNSLTRQSDDVPIEVGQGDQRDEAPAGDGVDEGAEEDRERERGEGLVAEHEQDEREEEALGVTGRDGRK